MSGVVLAGGSAGANCWFEASTTDSFGPLAPLADGLGLLPGSYCPHYADEPGRRPLYQALVAEGFPAGIACDDLAAVHYVGTDLVEVVASIRRRARTGSTEGPTGPWPRRRFPPDPSTTERSRCIPRDRGVALPPCRSEWGER